MKVLLRNPKRELEIAGPMSVEALLRSLELNPEGVLVIRGDTLATKDEQLADNDRVEIRPVISGGAVEGGERITRAAAARGGDAR